jgi:hypothetical protein
MSIGVLTKLVKHVPELLALFVEGDAGIGIGSIPQASIVVNTLTEAMALPNWKLGKIFETRGYDQLNDGGGNTYEVVTNFVGTVDGGRYVQGLGVRFRALFPGDVAVPEQFGAKGNNATEAATAMGNWLDACLTLNLKGKAHPGSKYRISSTISRILTSGQVLDLDFAGSELWQGGNNLVLDLKNSAVADPVVTTSVTQESVNLGDGSTNTQVMLIQAAGHPYTQPGQIGKIFSSDLAPDSDGANQFIGEYFVVGSVISPSSFTTTGIFEENYVTNPKVVLPSNAELRIKNLTGRSTIADGTTASFINVTGFNDPELSNMDCEDINAVFLNLVGNYKAKFRDGVGSKLENRPDLGKYGYYVNDGGGFYTEVSGIQCTHARHAYTTSSSTSTVAGDNLWYLKGRTLGSVVRDSSGQGCANAFDTHSPAKGIQFINCVTSDDYRGNATGGAGIQLRGNGCSIIDCDVSGSKIGIAISGASKTSASKTVIRGLKYRKPSIGHLPISVNGSTSYPTTVYLEGGVLESRNGVVMTIVNAEVFARNVMATVAPPNNGTFLVSLGDNASIKWHGGNLDIQSGTGFAVVSHEATNTKSYFDGLDITGALDRISYFATSAAQYAIESRFKNIQMDAALAGIPFVGTEATAPKVSAEYTVGFNGKPLAYRGSTYGSAGAQTLDLQFAGDQSVYWRVTASVAGVSINTVSRGAFPGQRLIIGNHTSSVSTLSISNNSGGLLILGTGAVLDPGEGLCLVWDGSNWRSAAQHF